MANATDRGISGYRRPKTTRRSVRVADVAARTLITCGGIGTILAVSLVCIFLVWVVVPLFIDPETEPAVAVPAETLIGEKDQLSELRVNEYLTMGWGYSQSGTVTAFATESGKPLESRSLFEDGPLPSAVGFGESDEVAFGFPDGRLRLGRVGFTSRFLLYDEPEDVPAALREMEIGERVAFEGGVVELTPERQYRKSQLEVELDDPVEAESGHAIVRIDQSVGPSGEVVATLSDAGVMRINRVRRTKNLMTGKVTLALTGGELNLRSHVNERGMPGWMLLSGLGDNVYMIWEDGAMIRIDTREISEPVIAERLDLTAGEGSRLTSAAFLIGKTSLVTGDDQGRVRVWFRVKPEPVGETLSGRPLYDVSTLPPQPAALDPSQRLDMPPVGDVPPELQSRADDLRVSQASDRALLLIGHEMPQADAAVTSLRGSTRSRILAAGYADASVRLFFVTSNRLLAQTRVPGSQLPVTSLVIAPKDDAFVGTIGDRMILWRLDAPHPEVTLASIFTPVWYEGYASPQHVWQSSSGTDDFEEKYGLYPLVFGTIKATIYSMIFGAPLALLAAIYSSEFMNPKVRGRVKPLVEMMASLPSVVLGFLAALFFAPLVEDVVPQVLTCFVVVPFTFVLGGYLWQMLPPSIMIRYARFRLIPIMLTLPIGIALAWGLGPIVETWLFAGDIKAWLDGRIGHGAGAWMFLLLPVTCLAVALASARWVTPWIRGWTAAMSRQQFAVIELIRFLALSAAGVAVAYAAAVALDLVGMDPRGTFVDTYVQRNAMVVGFIMGFAIIPIIYTIADDALTAVPEHLRGGSLGAGATPWQTAVRIVIPTAMSGLFSALMIGFGRAVGETMIVLMAAGNTPVMDWNIFNGFRTLSANIAVELPEAPVNGTHFRMLFLAALVLFAMTFAINTVAEVVRLRFRKRAYQL